MMSDTLVDFLTAKQKEIQALNPKQWRELQKTIGRREKDGL